MDMIKHEYSLLGITMVLLALPAMTTAQNAHPHDGHYRSDSTSLHRTQRIGEVVVHGKYVDRVNKSAYNAVAIDTRKLRNTNLDLAHALDRVAGIKIREEGGVGSSVQLNLNGFTGQHVKVFIDGMPMDNANTSFGLNNIPAGFASQLQVYKGVVPVDFGGDAIGGVSNSYEATSTLPAGALRIKKGANGFDPDYYFDIQNELNGYKFRRVWPISGSKYLLEFYTDKTAYGVMNTSGKFAIADMENKSLTWVTGLPDASEMANYSIGYGDGYDGYYYLPISPAESSSTGGVGSWHHAKATRAASSAQPTIFKINAATGAATVFMTFSKNESVKAINIIKK